MEWINDLPDWLIAIMGVITSATAVTALLPNKTPNKILNGILDAMNMLAGNVLRNKNRDD